MNDDKLANHWVELFVLWKQSIDSPPRLTIFFFAQQSNWEWINCDLV